MSGYWEKEGSISEVAAMINPRFNVNGEDPSRRKVGLVDEYQIWAFMVDPFNYYWWSTFNIEGDFALNVKNTINHFPPLDKNSSSSTHTKVTKEFLVRLIYLHFCVLF